MSSPRPLHGYALSAAARRYMKGPSTMEGTAMPTRDQLPSTAPNHLLPVRQCPTDSRWHHSNGIVFGKSLVPGPSSSTQNATNGGQSRRGFRTLRQSTANEAGSAGSSTPAGLSALNRSTAKALIPGQRTRGNESASHLSPAVQSQEIAKWKDKHEASRREVGARDAKIKDLRNEIGQQAYASKAEILSLKQLHEQRLAELSKDLELARNPHDGIRQQLIRELMPQLQEESKRLAEQNLRAELAQQREAMAEQDMRHKAGIEAQDLRHQADIQEQNIRHKTDIRKQNTRHEANVRKQAELHQANFKEHAKAHEAKLREAEGIVRQGVYERRSISDDYGKYRSVFDEFRTNIVSSVEHEIKDAITGLRAGIDFIDRLPSFDQRLEQLAPSFSLHYPRLSRSLHSYKQKQLTPLQKSVADLDGLLRDGEVLGGQLHASRGLTRAVRIDNSTDGDLVSLALETSYLARAQDMTKELASEHNRRGGDLQLARKNVLVKFLALGGLFRRRHKAQVTLSRSDPEKAVFVETQVLFEKHGTAELDRRKNTTTTTEDYRAARLRRRELDDLADSVYRRALREQRLDRPVTVTGYKGLDDAIRDYIEDVDRKIAGRLRRYSVEEARPHASEISQGAQAGSSFRRRGMSAPGRLMKPSSSRHAPHETSLSSVTAYGDWADMNASFQSLSLSSMSHDEGDVAHNAVQFLPIISHGEAQKSEGPQTLSASNAVASDLLDTGMTFAIRQEDFNRANNAQPNSIASFWTFKLYRNAEGMQPKQHYCRTIEQAEEQAQKFVDEPVLGFDLEWEMRSSPGKSSIKRCVSLIQLAAEDKIALFHVGIFQGETVDELMPPTLKRILESDRIVKTGVNVAGDARRMRDCLDVHMRGVFELSHLYRVVEFSEHEPSKVNRTLVRLADQVQNILRLPLSKEDAVRTGSWSRKLNVQQVDYACSDAYAGLQLYHTLEAKRKLMDPTPPRPAFYELARPLVLGDGTVIPFARRKQTVASGKQADVLNDEANDEFFDAVEEQEDVEHAQTESGPVETMSTAPVAAKVTRPAPPVSKEVQQADSWASEWKNSLPADSRFQAGHAQLRAYHLWHFQQMSVEQAAAILRSPPLSNSTVASYIFTAVKLENLAYDVTRIRESLRYLSPSVHHRYQKIIDHVTKST